jgi:biopolymer transport protein TolQ
MIQVLLQAGPAEDKLDIVQLLLHASEVVKGVLLLLMLMSLVSWYVIGTKSLYLSRAMGRSNRFLDAFW